jgi:hypothetical protein
VGERDREMNFFLGREGEGDPSERKLEKKMFGLLERANKKE